MADEQPGKKNMNFKILFFFFKASQKPYLKIFFLFLISLIETLLEILIVLLIPILVKIILVDTSTGFENIKILNFIEKNVLIFSDQKNLLMCIGIISVKTVIMIFMLILKNNLLVSLRFDAYSILLKNYFKKNINYFKKDFISHAIRNLTTEINFVFQRFISPSIGLISDFILLFGLLFFLLFYDTISILILIIIFLSIFLLIRFSTKKIFNENSLRQLHYEGKWSKILLEIFFLFKEIEIFSKKKFFFDKSTNYILKANNSYKKIILVPQLSKQIFEYSAISFFILIIFFSLKDEAGSLITFSKLAIFVGSFFRMLPAAQRILVSFQTINSSKSNLHNYFANIEKLNREKEDKNTTYLNWENEIIIKDIDYSYGETKIFQNFNANIRSGEKIAIIGKTGSGKSTLLELMMGILKPDKGKIIYDNNIVNGKYKEMTNFYSYVSQDVYIFNDTLENNVCFFEEVNEVSKKKIQNILELLELNELKIQQEKNENILMGENGSSISGGQKQRIGIARALYSDKKLIFFDEPSSNLDTETERIIFKRIFEKYPNKTFIIVSHNNNLINLCDKKIILS